MLVYSRRFGFDIFYVNDTLRAIVLDKGLTEIEPAIDKHRFSVGLFPMGCPSSNVKTEGLTDQAEVESDE